jgi:hypothetical protein
LWACSTDRLMHLSDKQGIDGSNPFTPIKRMVIFIDNWVVTCLTKKSKADRFAGIRSDEEKFADELRGCLNPQDPNTKTIQERTLEKILNNARELSWQVTAVIRQYPKRTTENDR